MIKKDIETSRWEEIVEMWQSYPFLYAIAGFVAGLLALPALNLVVNNLLSFLENLVPEAFGIAFTVFLIDRLYSSREEKRRLKELQERLVREIGGQSNETAKRAADELRHHGWLLADNGLLINKNLSKANLSSIDLSGANLRDSNLEFADLTNANLERARLTNAYMDSTRLNGCNLAYAEMVGANLSNSDLSEARLFRAELVGAKLLDANLSKGYLRHIRLQDAFLINANLQGADLRLAKLQRADLFNADLSGANLRGALLEGTHLHGANLDGAVLTGAVLSEETVLPDGTKWDSTTDLSRFGVVLVMDEND